MNNLKNSISRYKINLDSKIPDPKGEFVLYEDIKKLIIECCDDEPHDILSNFAEMFNLPELYELND